MLVVLPCVQEARFASVNAFRAHVNVGLFHGAAPPDPAGLLEGTGKYIRHVKLMPGRVLDGATLESLINAAYRDIGVRLQCTRSKRAGCTVQGRSNPSSPGMVIR